MQYTLHTRTHTHNDTTGHLGEAYDELGNRYVIPRYCLSKPTNFQESDTPATDDENSATQSSPLLRQRVAHRSTKEGETTPQTPPTGVSFIVKVRLTTLPKDIRVSVLTTERVRDLKRRLHELHSVDPQRITMLYSGRVLTNNTLIKHINVPRGHVIQAVVT